MRLSVTIKPKSKQEKVEKTASGYVIYVKEPPVDNRANEAVIRVLSEFLGVAKSQIVIRAGLRSKHKLIEIVE